MSEKDQLSEFSREIIAFQRKNDLTDTEMALNSHVSVEHIHNIKAMRETPDQTVVASLRDYMEHKPTGK
ncbi:MAG: LBP_cg2779 family protein [Lactobacillus sp.]|uniref:LBP_cg2779 family protein n=1 Tax=Lacticaseibacillus suilingensis TaxID=2799577 RepID=A0ABW4BBR5_9LACO|nr:MULTISPECIES: LBP_cg2779 family protein [Lacticaseibacillus]MCI1894475.1 LBP_cg2779 family protein [Lactobacillus sp.]MCI1916934.1 LBP_cg2779 family protein [Lactobacillus sp.]MCI1941150.1 LBP_cg2779 family protein [Lactobacillus sp.]MCI1971694.1 LBP_cg2779 family protein [Lactobacillus sp.]MCI2016367.1 LBP_cg2779 family protein [Lactobacillus sp.]